ncbi:MAG: HEAT repeat domain-containing protein [Methanotrichaceae archaeon]|nr:HEAT repeat domain-containing protein [Methanotrichaceae archaeon]
MLDYLEFFSVMLLLFQGPTVANDVDKNIQDLNDSLSALLTLTALGQLNDTRAVDPLIQSLNDENIFVQYIAAEALGQLNDTRAIDPLRKALSNEDSGVRQAEEFIGQFTDRLRYALI